MKHIKKDRVIYAFSRDQSPVMEIEPGEMVVMETDDCIGGQIKSKDDAVVNIDWDRINPATGPVYIRGASAGDTLAVDIHDLKVMDKGVMVAIPGEGALGELISEPESKIITIRDGYVWYNDKVSLPLKPMIGVIGVAPEEGEIPTGTPGFHGGNMDCTLITPASRVFLPVNCAGALLGMGDLHAVMGDGEVVICGVEIAGEVTFSVDIIQGRPLPLPFLETPDVVATIYSAVTTDEAVRGAVHHMAKFLTEQIGLNINDAGMLMSIAGNLKFCQVVDPLKTVRMEFPKNILKKYHNNFLQFSRNN